MCYRHGITRKSAALAIAALQFVHGFGTFVSASVGMNHTSQIAYFVVVIASAINMWLALVLCVGVNMNRPNLILIWLGWAAVILIAFVVSVPLIALYSYAISKNFKGAGFATAYIMYALSFFLHCLFIHVVYGYYEEITLSRLTTSQEGFTHSDEEHNLDHGFVISTIKTNPMDYCEIKNEKNRST